MGPELIKALTEAGIAMTVVILAAIVGMRLIRALFSFTQNQTSSSTTAWAESVDMLQKAWSENTQAMREQTGAIRDLRAEIKEDRRFWIQQIASNTDVLLREIRKEAFKGAAVGAAQAVDNKLSTNQ